MSEERQKAMETFIIGTGRNAVRSALRRGGKALFPERRNRISRASAVGAVSAALALVLGGCAQAPAAGRTKIVVATSGVLKPFAYVDGREGLTGYDIDVARAVFAQLPEYDVSFETAEFTSVLAGLDTGRYQVAANNFAMNEDRKEKYIYSDPIFSNEYVLAGAAGNEEIRAVADIGGRTTEVAPGLNYAPALESYNLKNQDRPVKISYSEAELLPVLQRVESGKYDFQLIDKAMAQQYIAEHSLKLRLVDLSKQDAEMIGSPYSYLLVGRSSRGEELIQKINTALRTLLQEGRLSRISKQYFGADYAPGPAL